MKQITFFSPSCSYVLEYNPLLVYQLVLFELLMIQRGRDNEADKASTREEEVNKVGAGLT